MQRVQESNLLPIMVEHLTDFRDFIRCCAVSKAWKLSISHARPKTLNICKLPSGEQHERRSSSDAEDLTKTKLTQMQTWLLCQQAGILQQVQHLHVSESGLMDALASDPSEIDIDIDRMLAASEAVATVFETAKAWQLISCYIEVCSQASLVAPGLPPSLQHLSPEVSYDDFDLTTLQHLPDLLVLTLKCRKWPPMRAYPREWCCMLSHSFQCNLHSLHLQNASLDLGSQAKCATFAACMRKLRWLSASVHAVESQVQVLLDLPNLQTMSLQLLMPMYRSDLHSEMTLTIPDVHSLTEVVLCTQLRQYGVPLPCLYMCNTCMPLQAFFAKDMNFACCEPAMGIDNFSAVLCDCFVVLPDSILVMA